MVRTVDAHCHLSASDEGLDIDLDELGAVDTGIDYESSKKALAKSEKKVYPAAGIHPTKLDHDSDIDKVARLVDSSESIVAVGEIGIDFHHIKDEKERKQCAEVFGRFLDLAEENSLPVVVHSRDAEKKVLQMLENFGQGVYLHCFNGNMNQLAKALDRGYMIGVTPQVQYSKRVRNIVREAGLENLLMESDSPYLGDHPEDVLGVANEIADLLGVESSKVNSCAKQNLEDFLSISF